MTGPCPIALLALLAALAPAAAQAAQAEPVVAGEWDSTIGRIRIEAAGDLFTGTLVTSSGLCKFEVGSDVLKGTMLDDSFAGKLRICLRGKTCKAKEEWASAILLATSASLSGAIHVEAKGCYAPVGKNGGLALKRASAQAPPAGAGAQPVASPPKVPSAGAEDKKARRVKAREILNDGAAYLNEGNFEAARRRFLEAIEIDELIPEAFNGVGVTWRMRNDLNRALEWYKKAILVDPDFGDAYYNMACVYALQKQNEMALRYLQIAALNGYATSEGIDADPDLEGLRGDPAYKALLRARM
jgi:tetratricopeptide (TPR) repeat protein